MARGRTSPAQEIAEDVGDDRQEQADRVGPEAVAGRLSVVWGRDRRWWA